MLLKKYTYIFIIKLIFLLISIGLIFLLSFYTDPESKSNFENNMIFILDTSHSMNVTDVKSKYDLSVSRLDLSKQFIKKQIEKYPDFKFGMIIFAGSSNFYIPPTTDKDNFLIYLDALNTGLIPKGGTNTLEGLKTFYGMDSKNNIGIFISDMGEYGDFQTQKSKIQDLAKLNSKNQLYIIGIGSQEGGVVSYPNKELFLKNGKPVYNKINDNIGKSLAQIFGVKYQKIHDLDTLNGFSLLDRNFKLNLDENTKILIEFLAVLSAIISL